MRCYISIVKYVYVRKLKVAVDLQPIAAFYTHNIIAHHARHAHYIIEEHTSALLGVFFDGMRQKGGLSVAGQAWDAKYLFIDFLGCYLLQDNIVNDIGIGVENLFCHIFFVLLEQHQKVQIYSFWN